MITVTRERRLLQIGPKANLEQNKPDITLRSDREAEFSVVAEVDIVTVFLQEVRARHL